jgi:hypothetical protein
MSIPYTISTLTVIAREVSIECTSYLTYNFSCWGLAVSYDEAVPPVYTPRCRLNM